MKNTLKTSLLLAALGLLGTTACSPEVPYSPTWEKDVRPLMVARCIRCHDTSAHVNPLSGKYHILLKTPAVSPMLNYRTNAEIVDGKMLDAIKDQLPKAVRGTIPGFPIMPPPPAELLEDWEIELIDNWAANPR